jgi:hypothetical protein
MSHTVNAGFMTKKANSVYRCFTDADEILSYIETDKADYDDIGKYSEQK